MPKKKRTKRNPQPYDTYALAEEASRDSRTNTARPSEENVVRTRHWSEENKL